MDLEQRFQACEGIVLFTRRQVGPGGIEAQAGWVGAVAGTYDRLT